MPSRGSRQWRVVPKSTESAVEEEKKYRWVTDARKPGGVSAREWNEASRAFERLNQMETVGEFLTPDQQDFLEENTGGLEGTPLFDICVKVGLLEDVGTQQELPHKENDLEWMMKQCDAKECAKLDDLYLKDWEREGKRMYKDIFYHFAKPGLTDSRDSIVPAFGQTHFHRGPAKGRFDPFAEAVTALTSAMDPSGDHIVNFNEFSTFAMRECWRVDGRGRRDDPYTLQVCMPSGWSMEYDYDEGEYYYVKGEKAQGYLLPPRRGERQERPDSFTLFEAFFEFF